MAEEQKFAQWFSRRRAYTNDTHRNSKTRNQFKPRNATKGTSSYQLRQFAEATLGSGSLRTAVRLPEGEELSEWLAVNGQLSDYMRREMPSS